jgi:DNA-binding beta-propeller fold protein YncE
MARASDSLISVVANRQWCVRWRDVEIGIIGNDMKRRWLIGLVLLASMQAMGAQSFKFLKSIPVGGEGGWDYLSVDAKARKLYVTHATKIVIIDLAEDKIAGEIADTPGVHGFAIASDLDRGFSSNGKESKVSVVDLNTAKTITKVETGENPDAILFEPTNSEVYAFNGRGKSATVIDARNSKVVVTVPLSGKPEFATADALGGRVFCNVEDKNEVAVIDIKTHAVTASWPLAPGKEPSGMAFDAVHHRLFVGCGNKLMTMLDSDTGKVVAKVPIGAGVDACAFDDATQLAFASCGDGTITIAKEEALDKLTVVQTLTTERGARTMALDPGTHRIYTCTAQIAPDTGPSPSPGERRRPNYVPGTFHVLVYGTE